MLDQQEQQQDKEETEVINRFTSAGRMLSEKYWAAAGESGVVNNLIKKSQDDTSRTSFD